MKRRSITDFDCCTAQQSAEPKFKAGDKVKCELLWVYRNRVATITEVQQGMNGWLYVLTYRGGLVISVSEREIFAAKQGE